MGLWRCCLVMSARSKALHLQRRWVASMYSDRGLVKWVGFHHCRWEWASLVFALVSRETGSPLELQSMPGHSIQEHN